MCIHGTTAIDCKRCLKNSYESKEIQTKSRLGNIIKYLDNPNYIKLDNCIIGYEKK